MKDKQLGRPNFSYEKLGKPNAELEKFRHRKGTKLYNNIRESYVDTCQHRVLEDSSSTSPYEEEPQEPQQKQ